MAVDRKDKLVHGYNSIALNRTRGLPGKSEFPVPSELQGLSLRQSLFSGSSKSAGNVLARGQFYARPLEDLPDFAFANSMF